MSAMFEQVHAAVSARLSGKGFSHSERVATMAAELASVYEVDAEEARLAGLLHDWHRETPAEDLVDRARAAGIEVTDVDAAVPYLLHGPLAALELADEFPGLSAAVLHAISAHTYGGDHLSGLDMVVYVADVLEPGRDPRRVGDVRALVGTVSLEELFARAYQRSLRDLVDHRRRIHGATVDTWNRFVAGGSQ